jgi:high-affinity nickel permease
MLGASRCAFVKLIRKLYCNTAIGCVCVIVALAVRGIKALELLAGLLHPTGGYLVVVARLNEMSGELAHSIVGLFVLSMVVSMPVYRWRVFDRIEIPQQVSMEAER